ncbi:catalase-like [Macrosteles quadrilineatus]|uniref:catalase-like n=1 Tax=Macrosteles quadrilineatus TaxID=74068 RepID=UPI0023E2DD02|nr:catalase-like [Macrosteles quadrilineatus]
MPHTPTPTDEQLPDFKKNHKVAPLMTTASGAPVEDKTSTLTAGVVGPIVLQDLTLLDELAYFDRERIPERVVHAKGAGAFGYFEVTNTQITQFCKSTLFSDIGKRTDVAVRFSFVSGESGSADTTRDPRGFAVKFYTEEGNWDLVGNNTPIFFMRDPLLFPSFIHTQKRNPQTHLKDANMFWDFITLQPQTTHQVMFTFSDRGIPDGYRFMNGYGSHTFKLVNAAGHPVYCKFHLKSNQGIRNLTNSQATQIAGMDADYAIRDLYNAIGRGEFPSWTFAVQIMTYEEAEKFPWNPFDLTKVWPQADYPLMEVGKVVLDRNPGNYFADVEQAAYSPSHLIPGIEPSPDKMLQARLFSYPDTHRYRLGTNFLQLPVNCPYRVSIVNNHRDGTMRYGDNQNGSPNYFPNSFRGQKLDPRGGIAPYPVTGDVTRYNSEDQDNFTQPALFWSKTLTDPERARLVSNIVDHLKDAEDFLQDRAVKMFSQVNVDFGQRIADGLRKAIFTDKFLHLVLSKNM